MLLLLSTAVVVVVVVVAMFDGSGVSYAAAGWYDDIFGAIMVGFDVGVAGDDGYGVVV